MADTWFENPQMGQRARLLTLPGETGGRSFVLEYVNRPYSGQYAVPPHLHPTYTETFEILAGHARYRLGGEERTAHAGERVVLPAGVVHVHPWSDSADELRVRQTAEADPPDLRGLMASLQGAITIFGLAGAGRVNARGLPNLLQLAVIAETTIPAAYIAGSPRLLQRVVFGGLGRVGRALGYRAAYSEYGVLTPAGLERPTQGAIPDVRTGGPRRVAGLAIRTTNGLEADPQRARIPGLWGRFINEDWTGRLDRLGAVGPVLAIYSDYESDANGVYRLLVGRELTRPGSEPPEVETAEVPAGRYLVFRCIGPMPQAVVDGWRDVWEFFARPNAPPRAYTTDLEVYPARAEAPEIWVAVRSDP